MLATSSLEDTLTLEMEDIVAGQGGVSIKDLASGDDIFSFDHETARVMASTTKLFTTGAALEALGPGFKDPAIQNIVGSEDSPTLLSLLIKSGHDSDNAAAAAVTNLIAANGTANGADIGGAEAIKEYARKHGANIEIVNGSGKGTKNLCSPATITDFLISANQAEYRSDFIQALPRAGKDGTLRFRMRNTLAGETVQAKTGTLTRNKKPIQDSLAGYVFGRSRQVAFAIVREHTEDRYAARASIDRMVDTLAHYCD